MKYISLLIQHHAGPTGDVLVCKNKNGAWQLPCGTVSTGETDEAAAARLALEKLHMTVTVGKQTMLGRKYIQDGYVEHIVCGNITHNTHTKYDYHAYYEAIDTWQTEPVAGEYTEFKWVHPSELGACGFEGDDKNFVAKYDPWVNGREIPDVRMY